MNYNYKYEYGIFSEDIGIIDIKTITNNYDINFRNMLDLIRDNYDNPEIMRRKYEIRFADGYTMKFTTFDLFINIIVWHLPVNCNLDITSDYTIFDNVISINSIATFIDKVIDKVRDTIHIKLLNNFIADMIVKFNIIDNFSNYTCNSISLLDIAALKNRNSEIDFILHGGDIQNVPFKDIKQYTDNLANDFKSIVVDDKKSTLYPYMRSNLGFSLKQFRECMISIGIKPNGLGGIFSTPILQSFLNGGCNNPVYQFIDASTARISQIIIESNVGLSGHFANMLSYNNIDTFLHRDPNYNCMTKNYITLCIENEKMLSLYEGRYYRYPNSNFETFINRTDTHLIGKTIEMRSPITCDSYHKGMGICHKCYGKLSHTNHMLSVGKIAADLLSERCTQPQLSAKHILEAKIKELSFDEAFWNYFTEDNGIIVCNQKNSDDDFLILESSSLISLNDEIDDDESDTERVIVTEVKILTSDNLLINVADSKIPLTALTPLLDVIDKLSNEDEEEEMDIIKIPLSSLAGEPVFATPILNDDLLSIIVNAQKFINRKDSMEAVMALGEDKKSLLSNAFTNAVINEADLNIDPIHLEVILAAQVYSDANCSKRPDWSKSNPSYHIVDLKKSIRRNPSVVVSFLNGYLSLVLTNYTTFTKKGSSKFDRFFME